ncbi:MAG: CrcB family protein [Opitutales bacterium]|nr:CrcB family protein [Opitutales bacterium]
MKVYLFIALGTGIGGSARYAAMLAGQSFNPGAFPWDTVFVNVCGSLLIGCLAALFLSDSGQRRLSIHWEHFLMTGVCGGFTTFSFLSWQSLNLWMQQQHLAAAAFALANVVGSLMTVALGFALAQSYIPLLRAK